jgi:hypothetical protein
MKVLGVALACAALTITRSACGANAATGAAPAAAPAPGAASAGVLKLDNQSAGKSFTVATGTRVRVSLAGGLQWSLATASSAPDALPVLRKRFGRVYPDGGSRTVFDVINPGSARLSAYARARCKAGEQCPKFVMPWHASISAAALVRARGP